VSLFYSAIRLRHDAGLLGAARFPTIKLRGQPERIRVKTRCSMTLTASLAHFNIVLNTIRAEQRMVPADAEGSLRKPTCCRIALPQPHAQAGNSKHLRFGKNFTCLAITLVKERSGHNVRVRAVPDTAYGFYLDYRFTEAAEGFGAILG